MLVVKFKWSCPPMMVDVWDAFINKFRKQLWIVVFGIRRPTDRKLYCKAVKLGGRRTKWAPEEIFSPLVTCATGLLKSPPLCAQMTFTQKSLKNDENFQLILINAGPQRKIKDAYWLVPEENLFAAPKRKL